MKMIWIFLLIVIIVIGMYASYRFNGENYSAGRGMFENSDYDMPEYKNNEFSDYDPYEFKNMRK